MARSHWFYVKKERKSDSYWKCFFTNEEVWGKGPDERPTKKCEHVDTQKTKKRPNPSYLDRCDVSRNEFGHWEGEKFICADSNQKFDGRVCKDKNIKPDPLPKNASPEGRALHKMLEKGSNCEGYQFDSKDAHAVCPVKHLDTCPLSEKEKLLFNLAANRMGITWEESEIDEGIIIRPKMKKVRHRKKKRGMK